MNNSKSGNMTNRKVTGSQAVILSLLEEGVDTIFGYPGGAIMPIYDALYDFDKHVEHILTRHEQGAVHAAQGYARVTGKPASASLHPDRGQRILLPVLPMP